MPTGFAVEVIAEDLGSATVALTTGSENAEYPEDMVQLPGLEG